MKKIVRKHDQLNSGSVKRMRSDGLIVEQPRRFRLRLPLRGIGTAVILGFVLKGLFLASIGADSYNAHLVTLGRGDTLSVAVAWLMQPDAVTALIAEMLGRLTG
ncbi:hypothetical protein [Yoonia sp.]|uniref:hypothetical protein n=1 Tax=Yoonia sp. TaxID=2212373 RepID=UPI00391B9C58